MSTAVEEIVSRADGEIGDLEDKLTDVANAIRDTQAGLDALARAREQRIRALSEARTQAEQATVAHQQAVTYATLARDTPNERQAIKAASDAKKAMHAAQAAATRLEQERRESDQVDSVHGQELTTLLKQLQGSHEDLQADLNRLQAARQQARAELGQEKYQAIVTGYHDLRAKVEDLRRQGVDAEVALHDLYEEGLNELEAWPELRQEIERLAPADNATLRVLRAALFYIETMSKDLPYASNQYLQRVVFHGRTLWDFILVPSGIAHDRQALGTFTWVLQQETEKYRAMLQGEQ